MFVSNSGLSCIILFELNLTILINYAVSSLSTPRRISIITNHPKSLRIFKIATEGKKSQWRLLTLASFLCKLFLATPKAACITPIQTSQVLTLRYPITPCCHADTTPIWSHQNVILNGCPNIWVDVSSSNGVIRAVIVHFSNTLDHSLLWFLFQLLFLALSPPISSSCSDMRRFPVL